MNNKLQQGFTLIILICTIVFLSLMAAVAFRFTVLSQQQVNLSLLSAKAQMAAKSVLEMAVLSYESDPKKCPSQKVIFDESLGALKGFEVHVSCAEPEKQDMALGDTGIYLKAEAIYREQKNRKILINYETGQWVPFPS
jgi:type II secretory pathway pseudopilin PulG